MINQYLRMVIKHPAVFLVLLGAASASLGLGMKNLRFDHSIEAFMPKDDPEYVKYTKAKETFGDNSRFLIMAVSHENLWSSSVLETIDRFLKDIEGYREYNQQRAEKRTKKLHSLLSRQSVSFGELEKAFSGDPVFLRLLKRKAPSRVKKKEKLERRPKKLIKQAVKQDFRLREAEAVDSIISPFTAKDISGKGNVLKTYPLIEKNRQGERIIPGTPEAVRAFKNRLRKNPAFKKGLYAVDEKTGRISGFAVIINFEESEKRPEVVDELIAVAKYYSSLDISLAGVPYVSHKFNRYMEKDLYRSTPIVLLVVILVFYFNFRSIRGVVLPFATLAMSELWTLGLMGHMHCPITTIAVTLPPLLISVGSSYAIHILNQYYADFNLIASGSRQSGLSSAMSRISLTVMLAGLTTAAAFLTLVSSRISAIQQWAVFSCIGIIFAVLIAVTLIPASLSLLPRTYPAGILKKTGKGGPTLIDRLLSAAAKGAIEHNRKIYFIVSVLLLVSAAGAARLEVDTEFLHYFRKDDPININAAEIGRKFGGAWAVNIIIDTKEPGGVKSPEFLKTVENLRAWLVSDKNAELNIGRTEAFSDVIKRMHMAMHNGNRDFFKIPDSRMTILDYLEIYSGEDENSDGVYDEFESYVDIFYQKTNILARLTSKKDDRMGTAELKRILGKIRSRLEQTLPASCSYTLTGYPVINVRLADYVVKSQLAGLGLSIVFVVLVVIVLFRKITAGPLAVIDMGVTVIINFGLMGWLGIELDMVTSVIATITIGIGVDDTIHFLNTYRTMRPGCRTGAETVEKTLFVSGKAIVFTSMALTFGFLSMVTSSFLPIVLFSLLLAATMVNTTIGSILLIPAAIRLTGIRLERPARQEPEK